MSLKIRTICSLLFALPLVVAMFGERFTLFPWLQFALATAVQFGAGYSFYAGSWNALRRGSANMDVLVAVGTSAAYFYSVFELFFPISAHLYFETSAVLIALILLGRSVEERVQRRATRGMEGLLKMVASHAFLIVDGKRKEVPIDQVKTGALVSILPGEHVPIDGTVESGASSVDESMLSGESLPVHKTKSDPVFSGTINGEGALEVKATSVGSNTGLARMIRLVQKAQRSKPPIQRIADKIATFFVPITLFIAVMTLLIWGGFMGDWGQGLYCGVAVLVIACPCALGLATPIVVMAACARGAKDGILIKDVTSLEKARLVTEIVMDKTGTITEGKLHLDEVVSEDPAFLKKAAALAGLSNHPLSQAIMSEAEKRNLDIVQSREFKSHSGLGLSGRVSEKEYFLGSPQFLVSQGFELGGFRRELEEKRQTVVALAEEGLCIGYLTFIDRIREGSIEVIKQLQNDGKTLSLLSGDRKDVVEAISQQIGFDTFFGEVLPEEKAQLIASLRKKNKVVAMVGDGVNDALALAEADVSFAVGAGTDVAMDSATFGLMNNNLSGVLETLRLSQVTFLKIRQNLFFAFVYNCLGIPIAAIGLLNPMIAGFAMGLSSICVVLNSVTIFRKPLD